MKRKLLLISVLSCVTFAVCGAYIAEEIRGNTSMFDQIIRLHRIELLREGLHARIKEVQEGLDARNTRFFPGADVLVADIEAMDSASQQCFGCHHEKATERRLTELAALIHLYETAVGQVLSRPGAEGSASPEQDLAHGLGEKLLGRVHAMLAVTSASLQRKTHSTIDSANRTNFVLFALIAAGPVLVVGLSAYCGHLFGFPLAVLLDATRRLKAGDLDHRVVGLKDEFGELGASFNEMATSLKEQMAQLHRTEQLMVSGQLATGIAHEIRNPISAIKVSLQVLAEDLTLSEEDAELFANVQHEAGRIENLMKDLLGYARPGETNKQPVEVNRLVERAETLALRKRRSHSGEGAEFRWNPRLDPTLPAVYCDPDQLFQVFLNVILNGLDAMPAGGTLTVETSVLDGYVRVDFSDEGSGVLPELREKIFEPFFTKKPKGTGLGLAICRVLVEKNGGTIGVIDTRGAGACFRVALPVGGVSEVVS